MKTAAPSRAFGLALAALALGGCSPASIAAPDAGTSASDGGPSAGSIEQACKNYAYARCMRLETCSATLIETEYGDIATCESLFAGQCVLAQRAPGSSSSLAQQQACMAALPDWACPDIIFAENVPPACAASPGSLADGAPCAANAQCQSTWCARAAGSSCGTCGPPPKAGDPCKLVSQCGSGLTCVAATGTCTPHAALGTSCASAPCDDGLACAAGICQATVATMNAPCSTAVGCDSYAGLSCNGASGTCQTLTLAAPGQACGFVENQYQGCKAGACSRGSCVGDAPLGGACDLAAGPSCLSGSVCVVASDGGTAGTCQLAGTGCF